MGKYKRSLLHACIWLLLFGLPVSASGTEKITPHQEGAHQLQLDLTPEEKIWLAMKFKPVMKRIYQKYDYHEYGGALLLGINGTAIICHGSSHSRTIKNAIMASKKFYTEKINDKIVDYLSESQCQISMQNTQTQELA